MKKFRFCALCLVLAALLSACGRQAAQDVPGAAAVLSPAAVPEIPAESTSTPSPTAPAEIGKELPEQVKVMDAPWVLQRFRFHNYYQKQEKTVTSFLSQSYGGDDQI